MWEVCIEPSLSAHVLKDNSNKIIRSGVALQGEKLVAWYKSEAAFFLKPRVATLAVGYGFKFTKVSTRVVRSRWGSCSTKGNISLNVGLILAPEWVSDAIILHELVHTVHHNHGKQFWRELLKICPRWDEAKKWLESNYKQVMSTFYPMSL